METVATGNEEAVEAWDGVLYDRFVKFRHIVTAGLGAHGDAALRLCAPQPGERALDIGCGFGDTSQQLAELVGPDGEVVGVDAAPRFIETAREEAQGAGIENLSFIVGDMQTMQLEQRFDLAFARFGTMFFANPVAALRNVCASLVPGGRLCMVVWRRKLDNEWLHRAELVVEELVTEDENSDEPTCGPGPFSMADADTTSHILVNAGFDDIAFNRCDRDIEIGRDLDEAVDFAMALGPAGEAIRLAGEEGERARPRIVAALREALADYAGADAVRGRASTWLVTARAPS